MHVSTRSSSCLFAATVVAAVLSGCASLDESQCRAAHWSEIGLADGTAGMGVDRLNDHRKACAEYGIQPDPGTYLLAREQGLRTYCTAANAVQEGLAGRSYRGVCPPELEPRFAVLHGAALAVNQARGAMEATHSEIHQVERELRSDKISPDRRIALRDELRRLDLRLLIQRSTLRARDSDLDTVLRAR